MERKLIPVSPTGHKTMIAFVDNFNEDGTHKNGDIRPVTVPAYPDSEAGRQLRKLRIGRGITLRNAAALIGVDAVKYSGLEHGRFTMLEEDWAEARRILEDAP